LKLNFEKLNGHGLALNLIIIIINCKIFLFQGQIGKGNDL